MTRQISTTAESSNNGGNCNCGGRTTAGNPITLTAATDPTPIATTTPAEPYEHYEHNTPLSATDTTELVLWT